VLERFLGDRIALHVGDCRDVLARLDENSIDACATDPPYHLTSIVKRFGAENAAPAQFGSDGRYARASAGFMGKHWDGGDIAFDPETWRAVWRVLKPGAHLLAMGGTRTYHRLACAIEDAGFEIRDCIQWLYGSGFPKSHSVAARQWDGWGTALKPACEMIVLARKPLSEGTIAANVLKWGTGAINVDGCRIEYGEQGPDRPFDQVVSTDAAHWGNSNAQDLQKYKNSGRWPANIIHDGSEEVVAAFPETTSGEPGIRRVPHSGAERIGQLRHAPINSDHEIGYGDSGSAARFFYTAKADSDDRLGSSHPTVKPLDLMQYLVRLITPPKGTCLDPFAGTGTTGEAAWREGMSAVLIEREEEYCADIRRRMALALAGPDERTRESIKAKNLPRDDGPLFDWIPQSNEYDGTDDFDRSIDECYRAIRERKAAGGKGWPE
jgi:site-specific DNA-methyltransferase (adenine-specific)